MARSRNQKKTRLTPDSHWKLCLRTRWRKKRIFPTSPGCRDASSQEGLSKSMCFCIVSNNTYIAVRISYWHEIIMWSLVDAMVHIHFHTSHYWYQFQHVLEAMYLQNPTCCKWRLIPSCFHLCLATKHGLQNIHSQDGYIYEEIGQCSTATPLNFYQIWREPLFHMLPSFSMIKQCNHQMVPKSIIKSLHTSY